MAEEKRFAKATWKIMEQLPEVDKQNVTMDPSGFVLLADLVPGIVQEIRYYSTYNFVGERVDGYEDPVALLTKEAARRSRSSITPKRS